MKRLCTGAALILGAISGHAAQANDRIGFNDLIRPILSENCFACHGPDSGSRKADLRLDTVEGATADGAIVPGDAQASELVKRILHDDPEEVMPPPDSHKKLTPGEKELLARWIDAGAEWQEHWAFIKPQRPDLPHPPGAREWARNPIDHFVLAKLRELGLEPNPEADHFTLARRAALDLTGLPPDQDLVESFIRDDRDDAFTSYVRNLLVSPHAAEHQARYWMDAARYGDTHGMHLDNYREMWPYRDWVIDAFAANMPFDRFVIEQMAGDLLPEATLEQLVATGFGRCNVSTAEGGAIPAELDVLYMVDRVSTTATVFLGLTAGCAVCHDHKYDPISQRDFYQLGAFFNNTTQPAMDGNQKDSPPVAVLPRPEFEGEWSSLEKERARVRRALRNRLSDEAAGAPAWWAMRESSIAHPIASDGMIRFLPLTEGELEAPELPMESAWAEDHPAGRRGVRFGEKNGLTVDFPRLRADEPLSFSFWLRTPDKVLGTTLFDQTRPVDGTGKEKKIVGWKITTSYQNALTFELFDGEGGEIKGLLPGDEALAPRVWQHVCVRYSGGQSNSSVTILVNGEQRMLRNSTEDYAGAGELADAPLKIGSSLPTGGLSDIRIFNRWLGDDEVRLLAAEFRLKELLESDAIWDGLNVDDRELVTLYHDNVVDGDYREQARLLAATQLRRDYIYSRSDTSLVMQERRAAKPRAWILERGEYDKRLEEVGPAVPGVLPPLPEDASANRLGLARWLVAADHPLTARVTVNRLWQSLFGTGLVKTAEDFGVMGDRPSHPELLDWLAVEFVESGWDVRHMLELMVTSAAYRQSSAATPEKLRKDPQNRFLARGSRYRLDAEALRDQALAVGGLLCREIGGPSVKPYQPDGLWKVVAQAGSNTKEFKQDSGDALYRRSVYTFWKRTAPAPAMEAFNAPTREQCTVRRERTNTPLQALVLLNDPQFVEAARGLAEHTLKSSDADPVRAQWILKRVFARPPAPEDVDDTLTALVEFLAIFKRDPEGAARLIETGDSVADDSLDVTELAAWTMVANTLMNRDDFVNKQ